MTYSYGDMVKISFNISHSYSGKYKGQMGEVERLSGNHIGVKLKGELNKNSRYGIFWFEEEELEHYNNEKENYIMDKNFKVYAVKFLEGANTNRTYYYAGYEKYDVDDYVVVHTGHHGMALTQVVAVDIEDKDLVQFGREIICKVDTTAYNKRKEREAKKAKLKKAMETKIKELQEIALFEMLAEKDTELAEMLSEFKKL